MPHTQTESSAGRTVSRDRFVAPVLFLGLFGLYLTQLAPGLTWGDGPELTAAASTLGIPHPPGYPLYTLLGKTALLLPFGAVCWRLHLLSALCMAGAGTVGAALIEGILRDVEPSLKRLDRCVLAAGGTAVLCFAPIVWFQAIQTEVYALETLLTTGLLLLLTQSARNGRGGAKRATVAILAGCCLVHHYIAAPVLLLALGISVWEVIQERSSSAKEPVPVIKRLRELLWGLLPLSLLLVLPLRSLQAPPVAWFTPHTGEGFRELVLGGDFARNFATGLQNWSSQDPSAMALDLLYSLVAWGPIDTPENAVFWLLPWGIALLGLARLWTQRRTVAILWLFLLASHQSLYMFYWVADRATFAVPAILLWTLPLATGLATLRRWSLERQLSLAAGGMLALGLLLPLMAYRLNAPGTAARLLNPSRSYAEFIADRLPPGSLYITGSWEPTADNELYPLQYLDAVEHGTDGRDTIGAGFVGYTWYREQLRSRGIVPALDTKAPDYRAASYKLWRENPELSGTPPTQVARRAWLEELFTAVVQPEMKRRTVMLSVPPAVHAQAPASIPLWATVRSATDTPRRGLIISGELLESLPNDVVDYLQHVPGTSPWTGGVTRLEEVRQ